ncbi:MAG: HK97-gp10 family putative phage morphogenesis protein [Lautropia sp.]
MAEVFGIEELAKSFEMIRDDMQQMGARRIASAGARVIREAAKGNAQRLGLRKSGAMINNIAIKREPTGVGIAQYHVGVRHGRNVSEKKKGASKFVVKKGGRIYVRRVNDPFYWRFLELDRKFVNRASGSTETGATTYQVKLKNGKVVTRSKKWRHDSITGRRRLAGRVIPGKRFMRDAADQNYRRAISGMETQAAKEVKKWSK